MGDYYEVRLVCHYALDTPRLLKLVSLPKWVYLGETEISLPIVTSNKMQSLNIIQELFHLPKLLLFHLRN